MNFPNFFKNYKISKITMKLICKIITIFLKEYSLLFTVTGDNIVFVMILLGCFLFYFSLFNLTKPYDRKKYYLLEVVERRVILIQISNSLFAALWISSSDEKNLYVGWFIFLYAITFNLIFFVWWMFKYQGFLISKLIAIKAIFAKKLNLSKKVDNFETTPPLGFSKEISKLDLEEGSFEKISKQKILIKILIMRIEELEVMKEIPKEDFNKREKYEYEIIEEETHIRKFENSKYHAKSDKIKYKDDTEENSFNKSDDIEISKRNFNSENSGNKALKKLVSESNTTNIKLYLDLNSKNTIANKIKLKSFFCY